MSESPTTERHPEDPDVLDLIRRAQAGDYVAFENLIRLHYGKIYGLVYGITGNREETETLVQETFRRAWKTLGNFYQQTSLSIWIYRIALNRTLSYRRKHKRRRSVSVDEFDPEIKTSKLYRDFSTKGSVLRKINLSEFQEKIEKALLPLSDKNRAVVVMHDVQQISYSDIAEILLCSEGTVGFRLVCAYKRLRVELAEFDQADRDEKPETAELNINGLLALKAYERPDKARVEKNIQSTMRLVRETSNVPSLLLFSDKNYAWLFTQPRYGIAALFLIFLGMHLLKNPVPAQRNGLTEEARRSVEEKPVVLNTNQTNTVTLPTIPLFQKLDDF